MRIQTLVAIASHVILRPIGIRRRIGCGRAIRSARWYLFRSAARQFIGPWGFAGFAHRRRDLRLRIARRIPGGGSVGVPGVDGGISGGSIGIGTTNVSCRKDDNDDAAPMFPAVPSYSGA
ncbi:hypothetical protein JIR23_01490 [Bradyrhizobium diazoefficiens]|nr:hypothetical protein JIR23_01490 [Bradyrhizobium diazoefficiens]